MMKLEMMPLSQLLMKAHPENPKDHDIPSLIDSFQRWGFTSPPGIDEVTQVMIAGHGRCEALEIMRKRGDAPPKNIEERGTEWMVPVVRGLEFANEDERDAYIIADNQNVMAGGWKFDILGATIQRLRANDPDGNPFAGLGFQEIELNSLLGQAPIEAPDGGMDPEATEGNEPSGDDKKPRTEITARIECPHCGKMFDR